MHFSWGFSAFSSTTDNLMNLSQSVVGFGINTLIGNGSETPRYPLDNPLNFAPPTQRWLWWEVRAPKILSFDSAGGTVWWGDSARPEADDSRAQVTATGLGAGQNLDVWATWQASADWPGDGLSQLWWAVSFLLAPAT